MQTETKDTPRLVKWANDNYPPIDLNSQYGSVIALINSYKELKEENEILKTNQKELVEVLQGVIRVADRKTDEFDKAKEAINKCK